MIPKLCAYRFNNQTVGLDLTSWQSVDLNNNAPFIIAKDGIIPPNYVDITSLENVIKYADNLFYDYQEKQRFLRLIYYTKTWENLNDNEKDIVVDYYLNPDKGDNVEDTKKVVFLMSKGMSLTDAKIYLVDCWSLHFDNYVKCCRRRLNNAAKVLVLHMNFSDIYQLEGFIYNLKLLYLNSGTLGIGYGDSVPAIMNFIMSNNGYETNGLDDFNFINPINMYDTLKLNLENAFMDSYIWNELKVFI